MADEAEMAEHQEQLARDLAMRYRIVESNPEGICLFCQEPISQGRYCDGDCRSEHEHQLDAKKRNGA